MRTKRPHHSLLLPYCALGLSLLTPSSTEAAVFNYAAQLQNIVISRDGNAVTYQVHDPALGKFVEEREPLPSDAPLLKKDGIILWSNGPLVYARFYDPSRRRWIKTEVASTSIAKHSLESGVVTWSDARFVNSLVFDLSRDAWKLNQDGIASVSLLQTADGTVTWSSGETVYSRVYDPVKGKWVGDEEGTAEAPSNLKTRHGIIAWSSRGTVYVKTYDPVPAKWITRLVSSGTPEALMIDNGIVAWSNGSRVYAQAYDPALNAWKGTEVETGPISDLLLRDGTLTWTGLDLVAAIRGYDTSASRWIKGMTVPYASFGASAASGTAPLTVYFYDRSLGASGWGWDFGDGSHRFERSPHHTYAEASTVIATLTVHGPHGVEASAMMGIDLSESGVPGVSVGSIALDSNAAFHVLEAKRNSDSLLEVIIRGTPGQELELQASTDLLNWETITTVTLSGDSLVFVDPDSAGMAKRFYRAKVLDSSAE